ncbi:MAG: hypothetical protein R2715_08760 [Ilumatobacteraceae bacterium]
MTYVDGGWQHLVDQLRVGLDRAGVPVVRASATAVRPVPDGWAIDVGEGDPITARTVVLAVGSPAAESSLTGSATPVAGPAVEAVCLDLLLDRPAPTNSAFGLDVALYCSPHSTVARLAPDGHGLVSVMRYLGAGEDPEDPGTEQDRLVRFAAFAGVEPASIRDRRYLHRMTVAHGMPVAASGGLLGRPEVRVGPAGLFRAGDWVGETGMLADASAASATRAAVEAVAHCAKVDA